MSQRPHSKPGADAMAAWRWRLEALIQAGIDLLDEMDAAAAELEPDEEDEVISEDDGVVVHLRHVGVSQRGAS
jgi:hypothetical protein